MGDRDRRVAFFRKGAAALAKYRNGDKSLYICPICCRGFNEREAETGVLTLEHVPPQCLGGKPLLLTCNKCNSRLGSEVEVHASNLCVLKNMRDILVGDYEGTTWCTLQMGGEKINVALSRLAGGTEFRIPIEKNNPAAVERHSEYMKLLYTQGKWDGESFEVTKEVKFDYRLMKLAFLKSAFLLVTAWLGFGYALRGQLGIVRDQLKNPEKELLDSFWFVPEKEAGLPAKCIFYVTDPLPFFLVSFDDGAVILPSPDSPVDLYENVLGFKNMTKRVTGKIYAWPEQATMFLDFSQGN